MGDGGQIMPQNTHNAHANGVIRNRQQSIGMEIPVGNRIGAGGLQSLDVLRKLRVLLNRHLHRIQNWGLKRQHGDRGRSRGANVLQTGEPSDRRDNPANRRTIRGPGDVLHCRQIRDVADPCLLVLDGQGFERRTGTQSRRDLIADRVQQAVEIIGGRFHGVGLLLHLL
jgi:hypothetical protein